MVFFFNPVFCVWDEDGDIDTRLGDDLFYGREVDATIAEARVYLDRSDDLIIDKALLDSVAPLRRYTERSAIDALLGALLDSRGPVPDYSHADPGKEKLVILLGAANGRLALFFVDVFSTGAAYVSPLSAPCEFGVHGSPNVKIYRWLQEEGILGEIRSLSK